MDVDFGDNRLNLVRYYNSQEAAWSFEQPLQGVPKPFGSSPDNVDSLVWWHSYFSFVVERNGFWTVRARDGRLLRFQKCQNVGCVAAPSAGNASIKERLKKTASGFALTEVDGTTLGYDSIFDPGADPRYFLSWIDDKVGPRLATLNYAEPAGLNCVVGGSGNPGVPYIGTIETTAGTLVFQYVALANASSESECVIDSVHRRVNSLDDGGITTVQHLLLSYAYPDDGSGTFRPGRIASATWASNRTESYVYGAGLFTVALNGFVLSEHRSSGGVVTGDTSIGSLLQVTYSSAGACETGSDCCGAVPRTRTVVDGVANSGDVASGMINFEKTYSVLDNFGQTLEPRLYEIKDACPLNPNACSAGSVRYEWACADGGDPGHELARKDKRDNWESYSYALNATISPPVLERTGVMQGATDKMGTDALRSTFYSYSYGGGIQVLDEERVSSVVNSSGNARTTYLHDLTNPNRLAGIIKSGWSRNLDGTSTGELHIATFYRTQLDCDGTSIGNSDPSNRTLQVDGPCSVSSTSDTACTPGTGYPVTRYEYWSSDGSLNANKLKSIKTYPQGCGGAALTTLYEAYDLGGNPTEITDPNGVISYFSYSGRQVSSKMVGAGGPVTNFNWENDELVEMRHPEGDTEVYCYRDGHTQWCSGNWTGQLQWKARFASGGNSWSEKVAYAYWPDGTELSESYSLPCASCSDPVVGEIRRVEQFAADAHRRPRWENAGTGSRAAALREYDANGNLRAVGQSFNDPPPYCQTSSGQPSKSCRWLEHDRLNRLAVADGYASASSITGNRTCFDYDAQGNIRRVSAGCSTSDPCAINSIDGGVASCSSAPQDYEYDDFGNLTAAMLPWTGDSSGPGTMRFTYNAQGNVLAEQSEQMRISGTWIERTYDSLGRQLAVTRKNGTVGDLLFDFGYDESAIIDPSCPVPTNTKGRLLFRDDSFGRTWFAYDEEGRVTEEIRQRDFEPSNPTCDGTIRSNPHTLYSWTPNGNLDGVTYPHGRMIKYLYERPNRVTGIESEVGSPRRWESVVKNVEWEPYGGLRYYAAGELTIEYMLGDSEDDGELKKTCQDIVMPLSLSDSSGRLRAIVVSSGAQEPGEGAGNLLKRVYRWHGEQIVATDTCVLDQVDATRTNYEYDGISEALGSYDGIGSATWFGYSSRRNRTSLQDDVNSCSYGLTHGNGAREDLLLDVSMVGCGASLNRHDYIYDLDGRTSQHSWVGGSFTLDFVYGDVAGGLGAVYSGMKTPGGEYEYYYDALRRRRAKLYPFGSEDEYFYGLDNELLTDQGNPELGQTDLFVEDDYVWLGGRPVLMIRDNYDSIAGGLVAPVACGRNEEEGECGVFSIVSDHVGAPIAMFDSDGMISGYASYDTFGSVNRIPTLASTAHPYVNNEAGVVLDRRKMAVGLSELVDFRVGMHLMGISDSDHANLESGGSWGGNIRPMSGMEGRLVSGWLKKTDGSVNLRFTADAAGTNYYGLNAEFYEYRRYQKGVLPMFTPLRYPGQYFDEESDLMNNWNRYYDPSTGRYLEPEPLFEDPDWVASQAMTGVSPAVYAYANNNPVKYNDPTGLFVLSGDDCPGYDSAIKIAEKRAGCDTESCGDKFSCSSMLQKVGVCDICPMLHDGAGPLLWFKKYLFGKTPDTLARTFHTEDHYTGEVLLDPYTQAKTALCAPGRESVLASVLIHEAMHACPNDPGDPQAGYYNQQLCHSEVPDER